MTMVAEIPRIERVFDRMETAPTSAETLKPGPNPSNRLYRLEGSVESTENPSPGRRACSVDGCTNKLRARGYCPTHWLRWRKYGNPLGSATPKSMEDRFWEKVIPTGFCWEWTAYLDRGGYGTFNRGAEGGMSRAHRVAYELLVGPIPEGLDLDHLCRNPKCVNPDHLEPVTSAENSRRAFSLAMITARTNICQRGHSMDDAYVRPDTGARQCAECIRLRWKGQA